MDELVDPIDDDELIYRRVPVSRNWYDTTTGILQADAFGPDKSRDVTGISVSRAEFKSIDEAARGQPGKTYYVAVLRAGDLRRAGIAVVPRPYPDDPGHVELPDLNTGTRKSDATRQRQRMLAEKLCLRIEGPYSTLAE